MSSMRKGSKNYIRIKAKNFLNSKDTVANPFAETQVFIEVHFSIEIIHGNGSGLLFNRRPDSTMSQYLGQPILLRLFQIDFVDLFASDIFRNCDLDALLSIYLSNNTVSTDRFWNFFKRHTSRFGNRIAKQAVIEKPGLVVIVVKLEILGVRDLDDDDEEIEKLFLQVDRCSVSNNNNDNNNQGDPQITSVLETFYMKKFDDNDDDDDDNNDDKETCSICLEEFEKGIDVWGTQCGHVFHTKCIIPWFNKVDTCPLCRDSLFPAQLI